MPGARSCTSCGNSVAVGARFCADCGSDASAVSVDESSMRSSPITNQIPCVACGEALRPENKFCPSCGAARPEAATVQSKASVKRITDQRLAEATAGEFEILQRIGYGAMEIGRAHV